MAYTDLDQRSASVHSYLTQVTVLKNLEELELLEKMNGNIREENLPYI